MASIQNQGNGGRRSLDAELNLVPFIDLLSMCICFLLMTAVWLEVSSLQMKQILGTNGAEATSKSVDVRVDLQPGGGVRVQVERQGKVLTNQEFQNVNGALNTAAVGNFFGLMMNELSAGGETPDITARVVPNEAVNYQDMVSVLDLMRSFGITQLGIVPVAGGK